MTELALASDVQGERTILFVTGEIDLQTAPVVRARIDELDVAHRTLVLDLDAVSFVDSSGLGCLLGVKKQQDRAGGRLLLARTPPAVTRILEITRMDRVFDQA